MIKYKTFKLDEVDELNKFVSKNEPLISKENNDNGISLHNGYFIVRYEDGTFNEKAIGLSNARQALNVYRTNVVVKTIEAQAGEHELTKMFKGESVIELGKKPKTWFRDYYIGKGLAHEQANELADKIIDRVRKRLLAEFEVNRTKEVNIPILEAIVKSYE